MWISRKAPVVLLVFMGALMIGPAARQSPAIDEVPHVGAALSYVQKLDMRMNGEHPPLAKVLAGIPLAIAGMRGDYSSVAWTFSDKFFQAYLAQWVFGEWVLGRWNDRQTTIFLARIPMIALTLALGWAIYLCGRRLGGTTGGLLCLSAYVSMPVFLTFGPMVLTDIPVALFTLLAFWAFAARRMVWFSAALACALLSKFSALLILAVIAVYLRYTRQRPSRELWLAIAGAFAIVYAVYFVLSWNQPMEVQHRIGEGPVAHTIGRVLLPPWLYLRGTAMVLFTASRPAFLLGESHAAGLPLYFPLLFAWKSTLGFLGLLILAALFLRRRFVNDDRLWTVVWVAAVVFSAVCILSRLNISFRHFTTPLVFLILLLAPLPAALTRRRASQCTMTALAISSIAAAAHAYPHFVPYVNALTFGKPAYSLIGDSNLDWNHALPEARAFAMASGVSELLVDSYGLSDPSRDVPGARVWDCQAPEPEHAGRWAVVSANAILESHNCAWLIPHIVRKLAGGSLYAVRLPEAMPTLSGERKRLFSMPLDLRAMMIDVSEHPEKLPDAFHLLQETLTRGTFADKLYPPKDPVRWPWE